MEVRTEPILSLFPKQQALVEAALSGRYRYPLYGGAIRGGKTVVGLALLFILCRVFPGSRWAITRKDLPTLRRNTLPALEKFRPRTFVGPMNRTEWVSTCANGSQIMFLPESIRDDPEGDRFRGLEVNGFLNEEVHEITEQTFLRQMERAGTWVIPGLPVQPPALIVGTCNPALGWVKQRWHDPAQAGTLEPPYFYLPARADDNPHIPDSLREQWKDLPETEYRRFVLGDWTVADAPDQLIKFEWVHAAADVEPLPGRQAMGVDVARFGADKTVLAFFEGNTYLGCTEHAGLSIDRTAEIVQAEMSGRGVGADRVAVDTVGLGAGVADILGRNGYTVGEAVGGAAPLDIPAPGADGEWTSAYTFKNLRSQMWWFARERLRLGMVRFAEPDAKLADDLLAPRYSVSGDRQIAVESKDDLKRRLGRSPDRGDAFVYGLFAEHLGHTLDYSRV